MSTYYGYILCQVFRVHCVLFWILTPVPWLASSSTELQSEGDLVCCLVSFVKVNKKSLPRIDRDRRNHHLRMDMAESV